MIPFNLGAWHQFGRKAVPGTNKLDGGNGTWYQLAPFP